MSLKTETPAVVPVFVAGIFEVPSAITHPNATTESFTKLRRPGVIILPKLGRWDEPASVNSDEEAGQLLVYEGLKPKGFRFSCLAAFEDDKRLFKVVVPPLDRWTREVVGLWLSNYKSWHQSDSQVYTIEKPDGRYIRGRNTKGEDDFVNDGQPIRIVPLQIGEDDDPLNVDYTKTGETLLELAIYFEQYWLFGFDNNPISPMPFKPRPYWQGRSEPAQPVYEGGSLANEIWIRLDHFDAADRVLAHDVALFTVAPIIFSSDVDRPVRLLSAYRPDFYNDVEDDLDEPNRHQTGNFGFARDLIQAAVVANVEWKLAAASYPLASTTPTRRIVRGGGVDLWCRDVCWYGYCQAPHSNPRAVMVCTPRPDRWLSICGGRMVPDEQTALFPQLFVAAALDMIRPSTSDSGGNMLVSPPVPVDTAEYRPVDGGTIVPAHPPAPYGKLLIGDSGSAERPLRELRRFFYAQRVQPLVPLDTSWLQVRHVDEIISFARSDSATVMFVASPDLAVKLLSDAEKQQARPMRRRASGEKERNPELYLDRHVRDVLKDFIIQQDGLLNRVAHPFVKSLDATMARLEHVLGVKKTGMKVVPMPVLFDPVLPKAEALLPNTVNMLQLGQHLVIPKPWGPRINSPERLGLQNLPKSLYEEYYWKKPHQDSNNIAAAMRGNSVEDVTDTNGALPQGWSSVPHLCTQTPEGWRLLRFVHNSVDVFEAYVHWTLAPLGFVVHFVDDWDQYHLDRGEVHCGTNVKRDVLDPGDGHRWWQVYDQLASCHPYPGCLT